MAMKMVADIGTMHVGASAIIADLIPKELAAPRDIELLSLRIN